MRRNDEVDELDKITKADKAVSLVLNTVGSALFITGFKIKSKAIATIGLIMYLISLIKSVALVTYAIRKAKEVDEEDIKAMKVFIKMIGIAILLVIILLLVIYYWI